MQITWRWCAALSAVIASIGLAFLDRGWLALLGALDLAARGQALVAQHAQRLDLGALAAALAELEHLDVLGAGHAVLIDSAFFFGLGAPQHQQLADVWTGAAFNSAVSSWYISSRAARSSLNTRILMRPWALRAASISLRTPGVRPSPPMSTTGSR